MAPMLPISLSPHICILESQDLVDLFNSASLPPLSQVLQAFSPLSQVTTRTTSLASVTHPSFSLRFSELPDIEDACREDDEQRAVRTLEWIGSRIQRRCAKWAEDMEKIAEREIPRTPWWDELKRCAEGEHTPSKVEGWNHPVAIILAVSTNAPNPLQAITALHARPIELPAWVDPTTLRYTLIVHPENSALSDEEAGALFNAVKKQFGLHSNLLSLSMPNPLPSPIPIPTPLPRLPPLSLISPPTMCEKDIQQTARFVREFLVMSLLPWMEKGVMEWNENFSSTRRLPSRIFTSTRRLFGSPSPSPAPTHNPTSSISSVSSRSSQSTFTNGNHASPPSQQRRLAEFATILGDYKLAITVWEALRKESRGGSDVLPLILAMSPASPLYVSNALNQIHPPTADPPPQAQLSSLRYAARWESGITLGDFIGHTLEGEKWLVWAAAIVYDVPAALLMGHAALLSSKKLARRKAAFWYASAASQLEKCGIKPLTMYFLRRAHDIYKHQSPKELSPLFWEAAGKDAADSDGFKGILSGIEHPLGRLLYTAGDVAGAVRFLLGLLKESHDYYPQFANGDISADHLLLSHDKLYLDDFRVAFGHYKSTVGEGVTLSDFKLSFPLCVPRKTTLRLAGYTETAAEEWKRKEDDWRGFWKSRGGKEGLAPSGQAMVDEPFWVDLVLQNPLETEVVLSNLTLTVEEQDATSLENPLDYVEVEVLNDIVLGPRELRTVPIAIKSLKPASLIITHASYDFLSILPAVESLAARGRRLHETIAQRVAPTYAGDVMLKADVTERTHKLLVDIEGGLSVVQGETKPLLLQLSNDGPSAVTELWLVMDREDEIWVGEGEPPATTVDEQEVFTSSNSLAPHTPWRIPLHSEGDEHHLMSGHTQTIPIVLHANGVGERDLQMLFLYRGSETEPFHVVKVSKSYEVQPLVDVFTFAEPSLAIDQLFSLTLEVTNRSSIPVQLTQVSFLSPSWTCSLENPEDLSVTHPHQISRFYFRANPHPNVPGAEATREFAFRKLSEIVKGNPVDSSNPPSIDILCRHTSQSSSTTNSVLSNPTRHFLSTSRRTHVTRTIARTTPHILASSYPHIFPLYNPLSADVIVFWEIPTQQRSGYVYAAGLKLGASHAPLSAVIQNARSSKVKRSMYVETQRERVELLSSVEKSEWNEDMNPLTLTVRPPDQVIHDFNIGPVSTRISFVVRNYSLTNHARYILRLNPGVEITPDLMPPTYAGRTTFRGSLGPAGSATIQVSLFASRPGNYSLGSWELETQVLDHPASPEAPAQVRHRYTQQPPIGNRIGVVICNVDSSVS
ncbi:hypothetical protein BDN72DRAFT_755266 [Pluteus cervinus]|uniref:Uncharacterized protein n=1 Tax=Pluteus cervinus TaxID=181527 RepID=A0ACD3BH69_9AGAR|nr:hypothetical protein BDN72DRAFT_755266 [Pluteus cervinus]